MKNLVVNFCTINFYSFPDIIGILIIFSFDSFDEDEALSLGQAIKDAWKKRKSWLEHDCAVTAGIVSNA